MVEGSADFKNLPENCISNILSFTTPRDACRASLVSHEFRSIVNSDILWERFLPPDYEKFISESFSPIDSTTKKDIYLGLCDGILIGGGRRWFSLERATGKICYVLGARDLSIIWSDVSQYWRWSSMPDSRFAEVAALEDVWWLQIRGRIDSRLLSTKTTYVALLIIKFGENARNLDALPAELSVEFRNQISRVNGYLRPADNESQEATDDRVAHVRADGWYEIELGDFYFDAEGDGNGDVVFHYFDASDYHCKRGLIVEGIEVRPRA